jgi:hypothetical protein
MFGSLNIHPVEPAVSPLKNVADIDSIYKNAWERLARVGDFFAPEEFGLLYHYLQTRDDIILGEITSINSYEEGNLLKLREFLAEKMSLIMAENFTEQELALLDSIRNSESVSSIFDVAAGLARSSSTKATSIPSCLPCARK